MSDGTGQYGFIQGMVDLMGEEYAHKPTTGEDFPIRISLMTGLILMIRSR